MAELADAGAAAFTDDGRPVVSAGLMRRALQYGARHRPQARAPLRGADALARRADARRRRSRPSSASRRIPSVAESAMVERDLALAAYEDSPLHLMHLSARESVEALARGARARRRGDRRGDAAPPRPHRRGRPLARPEREDEPAAPRARTTGRRCSRRFATARSPASPPTTRRTRGEEKDAPFEEAPFGVTGLETAFAALYTHLVEPGLLPLEIAARADVGRACPRARPARAPHRGRRAGEPRPARPRGGVDGRRRPASARARRTPGCSARTLRGAV